MENGGNMKKTLTAQKIGFIGCGNMAQAIISALYYNGYTDLYAYDPDFERLKEVNGKAAGMKSASALIDNSQYVFLAVKPKDFETAVNGLVFPDEKIPVSIMAGVLLKDILKLTKARKAVRIMPNLNALVRLSHNAYCQIGLHETEVAEIREILATFGGAAETEERMFDAITGLSGSGPAFVFNFFKGLLMGAESEGLDVNAAIEAAGMTIAGSVGTLLHSVFLKKPQDYGEAIAKIDKKIADVCSKGGTTIEGMDCLNSNNFTGIVSSAVIAAAEKAKALSGGNKKS
jgi:pyrroline-5-carboxylate reductase